MSYRFSDHQRQTNNVIRIATVEKIDWEARKFRAKSGDILTNWLHFPAFITQNYKHWIPLREKAQVVLLVDGGDYNTAVLIGMLWSDQIPAPDIPTPKRPHVDRLEFEDGTIIEYDSQQKHLTVDTPGDITIRAQNIRLESSSLTHNGTNIGSTHIHPGVIPGPSTTGTPQ